MTSTQAIASPTGTTDPQGGGAQRYRAAWRWHFWAGLFVVPFLLVLASTGLIMLYYSSVATPLGERLHVETVAGATRSSPEQQLRAAMDALPGSVVTLYIPAPAADRPVQFESTRDDSTYVIDVDPYTNRVLRVVDKDGTPYALARRIHSTLLMGDFGDLLLEIVAGLSLLLVATGTYMWVQRRRAPPQLSRRLGWRRWHLLTGIYGAVGLCFFLVSGLAWTNVWGGRFVQAWSTFPAERWGPVSLGDETHSAMNHGAGKDVPWGLEQTPLPASAPGHAHAQTRTVAPIALDAVDELARDIGFGPRYRINLPVRADGVYTISSDSMNGDIERPGDERTVHIDRHSGKVLAEVGFDDYSLMAKGMAIGVAVHQGSMGWWSLALDLLVCVVVIFLCLSGTLLWWLRRPARSTWLPVAPPVAGVPLRSTLTLLLLLLGIAFPLLGATLLAAVASYFLGRRLLPGKKSL